MWTSSVRRHLVCAENLANNVWLRVTPALVAGDQQDHLPFTWLHAEHSRNPSNSKSGQRVLEQARITTKGTD